MATVTVDYFGMSGTGRTVTEAKRDAGAKLQKAMEGDYAPHFLHYRGYAILVTRSPHGWDTAIICEPTGFRDGGRVSVSANYHTEEEVLSSARSQLAQLGWTHEDGLTAPGWLNRDEQREFLWWAEFQLRFRTATQAGLCHNDAHSYAGRNPARPELVAMVEGGALSVA